MEEKLDYYAKKLRKLTLRHELLLAVIVAVCFIVVGTSFGWYNNKVVPVNSATTAHYTADPANPLSFIANWDGPDYLNIAKYGYNSASANFFPLYPLLIHIVTYLSGSLLDLLDSAILISWLAMIGAIYFYIRLSKQLLKLANNEEALRALLFFVLFPTAVFLMATYTEALFSLLALAAIYYALNKRYIISGIFLAFATATHITGLFVLALVLMMAIEQRAKLKDIIVTAIIGSLGVDAFMYYLYHKFRAPLSFITAQKSHGWIDTGYSSIITTVNAINVAFIILIIFTAIYWWHKRRSFAIYSLLFLLIPILGKQFGGFNRYVLVDFPMQLMFYAYLKNKKMAYIIVIAVMGAVWMYTTLQYMGGYTGS